MSIEQASQDDFLMDSELSEEEDSGTESQYLTFCTAGQKFGIPVADIVQIIGMQPITPVPEYPDYAKGIINLREMVIPILDLRARFHKEARPYDSRTCIIITTITGAPFGLIADAVDSVVEIAQEQVMPAPQVALGQEEYAYLGGVVRLGEDLILIMDTQKIISLDAVKDILDQLPKSDEPAN